LEPQAPNPLSIDYQHLQAENARLEAELAGVAQANVRAAELMAELEEANENLARTSEELRQEAARRQQMEQMLFQSRSLLNNVLNSSLDGICVFQSVRDRSGAIVDFEFLVANPAALRLFASPTALVGQRLSALTGGPGPELTRDYIALVEKGQALHHQLEVELDGQLAWYHVVGVKFGDGLSVTFRNISELKATRPAGVRA